ncbi:hypothetical protein [Nonomuraea dietziae]|uniref:Uncharacterized protein n=1 Tax=Nonomuraea dietziae TaxID=65515 RepID=A0A7W5YDU9_9ACTN|nr:hypothetical protein [Nonomuraea dietziae]MBB3733836.1 hypothetical protein [Nonomuraea dietziae]
MRSYDYSRYISGSQNGSLTHTFEADTGHYKVAFNGRKYGGYWRDQRVQTSDTSDEMGIYLSVEVDVP